MKLISTTLQDWADKIYYEIENNGDEYFWPKSSKHKIFEQAYMKFVNRNLNYFHFPNMVVSTLEDDLSVTRFPVVLEFCNYSRSLTQNNGPFGRMCIWNLPPKSRLLPHVDNFEYHRHIIRNIFIVSENIENTLEIYIDNKAVEVKKGVLFQFDPARQLHSFINNSDHPFYFIGYDFWIENMLLKAMSKININDVVANELRMTTFGAVGTTSKYISQH